MTPRPPRAVLFQHDLPVGSGGLAAALAGAGFALEPRYREVRPGDADAELAVVLGGFMGAYEAQRYPILRDELSLLERRLARGLPTLGVCLGAQLLAQVAGARVYPDPQGMVVGVHPLVPTPAGRAHPVFAPDAPVFDVAHWHADTFDPVPGAIRLAGSERTPQELFALGSALGILVHPEVDASTFEGWARASPDSLARAGRTLEALAGDELPRLRSNAPRIEAFRVRLAHFLMGQVASLAGRVGGPGAPARVSE
ncbi:gamma-glutamyl-gamma-aminobutyrate hydrolase family protein [Corallococcus macrosporus]|uniref:Gamma-glutamyl-gamma-aminobutyrate hydrolase family protein n=1 Tax=Corallococcus macrosporus TaxID=35 RepID=A0ABS3DIX4_9BACT|nr:gamma-glutamyl-gamma-aminobutyrate hydrolase family protein [Corallococcus macrosporus]